MQQSLLKKTLLLMSIFVGMAFVVQSSTTIHAQGLPDLVLEVSDDVGGRLVDDGSASGTFNWVITLRNQGSVDAVFEDPSGLFDRSPNLFRFQTILRGVSNRGRIIGNGGSGIIGGSIRCHPLSTGGRCAYTAALTIEPGGFISLKIPVLVFFSFLGVGSEIRPSECVADPQGLLDESDEDNNICTGLVTVVAEGAVVDTTPSVIAAHGDESAEATSASGAAVTYTAPDATDTVDGVFAATCLPASGSTFPLGDTTVTCNASDAAGNAATATTFNVSVLDTTPPDVTAELVSVKGNKDKGIFRVEFSCSDTVDADPTFTATINGVEVTNGMLVDLRIKKKTKVKVKSDKSKSSSSHGPKADLRIEGPSFELVVTCEDASGNIGEASVEPVFEKTKSEKSDKSGKSKKS